MELHPWPAEFALKKAGIACPQCEAGRVAETEHGVRYFAGAVSDGYLQREAPTAGYSVVVFRARHAGSLHELTAEEHSAFWREVGAVASAIERVYQPVHLNFQVLGNQDPHVHVHIVPRFDPDPAPGLPLPAEAWDAAHRMSAEELDDQLASLRAALNTSEGV
jgi:diadenosine tetraphosphate (Ap4A) HIT family hydrolase